MKPLFLQTSRYHDIKQPLSLSEGAHTQWYSNSSLYRFNLHLLVLMSPPYDTVWLGLATFVSCITVLQLRTSVQQCHFQTLGIPSHQLQMFRKGKNRVERNPQARIVVWQQQAAGAGLCLFACESVGKSGSSSRSLPGCAFPPSATLPQRSPDPPTHSSSFILLFRSRLSLGTHGRASTVFGAGARQVGQGTGPENWVQKL